MKGGPVAESSRKPPVPSDSHDEVDAWIRRVMPDLNPVVHRVDELVREILPGLQYAVKWKKVHYGLPEHGWVMELVSYDVSVNLVFFAGAEFDSPPPLGSGRSRYVKLRTLEEVEQPELRAWIEQAGTLPGWKAAATA